MFWHLNIIRKVNIESFMKAISPCAVSFVSAVSMAKSLVCIRYVSVLLLLIFIHSLVFLNYDFFLSPDFLADLSSVINSSRPYSLWSISWPRPSWLIESAYPFLFKHFICCFVCPLYAQLPSQLSHFERINRGYNIGLCSFSWICERDISEFCNLFFYIQKFNETESVCKFYI